MSNKEKESLLKNLKIKIKNSDEQNSANSKNRYNISGSNEMKEEDKDSSKLSGEEDKKIIHLNIINQEKDSNSNNSIIKEKSEEIENNIVNNESKSSENLENHEKGSSAVEESEKSKSSFLNSEHYKKNKDENEEEEEENDVNKNMNRTEAFRTTGKFMQIQPHFTLFNKRIDTLREGIYDNTKKCLIHKSSLQMSENLMRERANSIVKDFIDKLYNIREMFLKSNSDVDNLVKETNKNIFNLVNVQKINKNEIKDCDYRINRCERQIGYKLLGKPTHSFMKRAYHTITYNMKDEKK